MIRQIVDDTATVQFYQAYEPYGDVLASAGLGGTDMFNFAADHLSSATLVLITSRLLQS